MKRRFALFLLVLILGACTQSFPFTESPPTYDSCAFVWANKDLSELSETLENEIHLIDSAATARAVAFGENCVYSDGHSTFGAIETDYYITTTVADISDYESFGNWISQTVPIVQTISEAASGPHDGYIEYTFRSSESDSFSVRVPLDNYEEKTKGLTGEDLFLLFQNP